MSVKLYGVATIYRQQCQAVCSVEGNAYDPTIVISCRGRQACCHSWRLERVIQGTVRRTMGWDDETGQWANSQSSYKDLEQDKTALGAARRAKNKHQKKYGQQVKGADSAPPHLSTASSSVGCSIRRMCTCWSKCSAEPQKSSAGWNTNPVRKSWESYGCSAWKREGSMETLPSSS